MEAAHNNPCVITIVGHHGNSVYRVVALIPVWVACGRFPWNACVTCVLRLVIFLFPRTAMTTLYTTKTTRGNTHDMKKPKKKTQQ
jgi:hypothetical protein